MPTSAPSSAANLRRKAAGRRRFAASIAWSPETREADDGALILRGVAAVFDSESHDLGGFTETLAPGCFARALRSPGSDQFLLWSHDPDAILARRSAGTLDLRESDRGLEVEARLVPTQLARDVHLLVRTGHATGMSFGFTVARDEWSGRGKDTRRRITEIGSLFEVTVTPNPAYPAAGASARSREQLAQELSAMKERARQRLADNRNERRQMPTPTKRTRPRPAVQVTSTRDPYAPGSPHSYFRDRLDVAEDDARIRRATETAPGTSPAARDARARLRDHTESRALSSTLGSGGEFLPAGAIPTALAEAFGASARARAVVTGLLPSAPLPDGTALSIDVPRFTNQGTVAVQATEAATISTSSPSTGKASSPVVTIAGQIEVSRQAFDRAVPNGFDTAISAELGAALAETVEQQILGGTGSSGQLTGLLNSASTSTTYTSASPTVAGVVSKIGECLSGVHTAIGVQPDVVAVHPRRAAWMASQSDSTGQPVQMRLGVQVAAAASMPLDGSSRDQVLVLQTNGIRLYSTAPQISVIADYSGSSTLTVKVHAYQYLALALPKGGATAGKITGSGLAAPTFA